MPAAAAPDGPLEAADAFVARPVVILGDAVAGGFARLHEGIDQRVLTGWEIEELSIGDYILTGGEPAAIVLIDAVARLIPGILGNQDSHAEESIYSGLLEYPQYTKPRCYQDMEVPEVLLSGDHKRIALWQYEQSLVLTKIRRPDLFAAYIKNADNLTRDQRKILEKVMDMM